MHTHEGKIRLSATDLASHLGCRHLTSLDLCAVTGGPKRPVWHDPGLEALWQRGLDHEKAYLDRIKEQGRDVLKLPEKEAPDKATERTRTAMIDGVHDLPSSYLRLSSEI